MFICRCTGDMVSPREAASKLEIAKPLKSTSGIMSGSFAPGIATSQVNDQLHSSGYISQCNIIFPDFCPSQCEIIVSLYEKKEQTLQNV